MPFDFPHIQGPTNFPSSNLWNPESVGKPVTRPFPIRRCPIFYLLILLTQASIAQSLPTKVFILAGQSNMEGQAVVDLAGKDYNEGKGTLAKLMEDPAKAPMFAHLKTADGKWVVRNDVSVRYQRENRALLAGPLTFGFSVYGDVHHFGPELQFGHVVGDALENPVLLIKTAWGGKSLYRDFRPPSSGGEVGKYYQLMARSSARNSRQPSAITNSLASSGIKAGTMA